MLEWVESLFSKVHADALAPLGGRASAGALMTNLLSHVYLGMTLYIRITFHNSSADFLINENIILLPL